MKPPKVELIMHIERSTYRRTKCVGIVGKLTQMYRPNHDPNCHLAALYVVNDQPYCKRHAGDLVLELLCRK